MRRLLLAGWAWGFALLAAGEAAVGEEREEGAPAAKEERPAVEPILEKPPAPPPGRGAQHVKTLAAAERPYLVYLPPSYREGEPAAMVLALTGATCEPAWEIAGWRALADRHGFLVVAPRMSHSGKDWGKEGKREPDFEKDLAACLAIHAEVTRDYSVDRFAVMASGYSAGGVVASRLAAEHPDLFPYLTLRGGNFFGGLRAPADRAELFATGAVGIILGEGDPYRDALAAQAEQCKAFFEGMKAAVDRIDVEKAGHWPVQAPAADWFSQKLKADAARRARERGAEKALRGADAALAKGALGEALASLRAIAPETDPRIRLWADPSVAALRKRAADRLAEVAAQEGSGGPVWAEAAYRRLADEIGSEEEAGKAAHAKAEGIRSSSAYEAELALRKAEEKREFSLPDYRIALRKLIERYPGTAAAEKAREILEETAR